VLPNTTGTSNQDEKNTSSNNQISVPSISLPKGGGAIRGIGEKFAANPVTGTGSMTVPIATSPGRSGFGPQLSLSYDSGAGNGPFGLGWSLSLPAITRKTDKGLPRYFDGGRDQPDSDVFILSGAEDLVPVLTTDTPGNWNLQDVSSPDGKYVIRRYQPRIEGLFARIERWTRSDGDVHWRSISKDNMLTLYGKDENSRIYDPDNVQHIFSWLICETRDDKGNAIVYTYKAENGEGVDLAQAHEQNRGERRSTRRNANRYLKSIQYGNRNTILDHAGHRPRFVEQDGWDKANWMFEVVFDYDEGYDAVEPSNADHCHYLESRADADNRIFVQANMTLPTNAQYWPVRQDPFSSYRAGFEVRTYRLCRRVLMFHHFPQELGINDYLVRSTEFTYSPGPIASFITGVTQSGYLSQPTPNQANRYLKKSLLPVEFAYSHVPLPDKFAELPIQEVDAESLENLPIGLDGANYQWMDLDGEGTSGILTEQANGWFYKRNLSANHQRKENGKAHTVAMFGPMEVVASKPAVGLGDGTQFLDLAGDGQVDLVQMQGSVRGFYERTDDADWAPFQPFVSWPNVSTRDPNLKFVDLTGDGHADILISDDDVFQWHESLAEEGFAPAEQVYQDLDEEKGPRLVFADGTDSMYLADMSGDGLTDLVRIRNGEVCYWPSLGYGRFGAKVTMDHAPPWFDAPDQFHQRRVRLVDTDGSGTTDIVYLHREGVHIYFNQSGNSWSDAVELRQFPPVDDLTSVQALDLLGNGTGCLVWSSALPGDARRPMRYIALMDEKPHLLIGVKNNLGAETIVKYAPSTKFYLDDKEAGNPWVTRLPFLVHVVERVEAYDYISRNRFVTLYKYHHGYFDGEEREFRGFGMVVQQDTEEFAVLSTSENFPIGDNVDESTHVPPVLTKTWFHTGAYIEGGRISRQFEHEYYREGDVNRGETGLTDLQLEAMLLDDTLFPVTIRLSGGTRQPYSLSGDETREASRSLKGAILRQEMYSLDKNPDGTPTDESDRPYSVSERNYTIELLQPQGQNRHSVFFTHARETVDFHYERILYDVGGYLHADPRVTHALTLEVDNYSNVLTSASIGYGRRFDASDQSLLPQDRDNQRLIHITYTENRVTNAIDDVNTPPDDYRIPLIAETRTYELRKPQQEKSSNGLTTLFRFQDILSRIEQASDGNHDIDYEDQLFEKALQAAANNPNEREQSFQRLIEHTRMLYRPDDLGVSQNNPLKMLPLRQIESLALPGESYKLEFTHGLARQIFVDSGKLSQVELDSVLANEGKYVHSEGDTNWWIPSGRMFYSPSTDDDALTERTCAREHFFLPHRYRDPFGNETFVVYDSSANDPTRNHNLLLVETRDALGNTVTANTEDDAHNTSLRMDYRVLQPEWVTDPNKNRTQVAFDALGMVVATAVMGKPEEKKGDNLTNFEAEIIQTQIDTFHDTLDPHGLAATLLKGASTRIVYDLHRFRLSQQAHPTDSTQWEPPYAATLARETHASDPLPPQGLKIQISYSYSDGFGREIQKKIQAEPGKVEVEDAVGNVTLVDTTPNLRWVGTGWTIFNNKGKPVRQYEPFFSTHHQFQFANTVGVSSVLFYDPVERVVATLHPNHTYEKVDFDPWRQVTYDVNDTVAPQGNETGDPRTDPDIQGYVAAYFKTQLASWQTWYTQRQAGAQGTPEQSAATKSAVHANTPTVAYFDTLGRTFLTVAHNKFERKKADGTTETGEGKYPTRIHLDIEGNQREVLDEWTNAQNNREQRIVMGYDYDMLGNRIHQASMEAGKRWMLNDVMGKPIRAWDSRDHQFRTAYDQLRRPTDSFLREGAGAEMVVERNIYGESRPNPEATNLRGKVVQLFDQAGVVTSDDYDFKGNLRRSQRQLAGLVNPQGTGIPAYKTIVDWSAAVQLEADTYTSRTSFDALNRPITVTTPDNSVYRPTFNEANLLDKIDLNLRGEKDTTGKLVWKPFVTNINFNAKGQRTLISYDNGTTTTHAYDVLTFQLTNLKTTRPAGLNGLASQLFADTTIVQDLHYTYDPVGNITHIADDAIQTIQYNNENVEPNSDYSYDAIYRLISAHSREHIGQTAFDFNPLNDNYRDYPFFGLHVNPNDAKAVRNYTETYNYDEIGNIKSIRHSAQNGSWTRSYKYHESSLLEPSKKNNRLTSTQVGNGLNFIESYGYTDAQGNDVHGCMTSINSMQMVWDFKDQLQTVNLGGGGKAYYVYDASGQRVRKVINSQNGTKQKERIYLGSFEIYREYNGAGGTTPKLVRETLHIMDDKQRIALAETQTIENSNRVTNPEPLQRYQFGNHLGSASVELDKDGALISYEEYHPYGTTAFQARHTFAEVSLKRYRYTGKERDEESGLYYHGARYYAPWLARWVSCDPMGIVDGPNLYEYGHANPSMFVDANGRQTKQPDDVATVYSTPGTSVAHGAGGVCSVCHDPKADTPTNKTRRIAEEWQQIAEAQVQYDTKFDKLHEEAKNRIWYPRGVTDDPARRWVEEQLGPRPEQPGVKAAKNFFNLAIMAAQLGLALRALDPAAPADPTPALDPAAPADPTPALDPAAPADPTPAAPAPPAQPPVTPPPTETVPPPTGDEPLFPQLTDEEVGTAVDKATSGTPARLPGQNPKTGEGLINQVSKGDQLKPIAHHDNMKFKGIKGAPGGKVEVRRHSANPKAPVGTYSHSNPTTQVNSVKPKEYMLPDGTYKPLDEMTEAEIDAAHFK
jgi:RHS repeat-associated protein